MSEESLKNALQVRKNSEKWPNVNKFGAPGEKKCPPDGIREPLSLLRKERNPSVTLRKPIQVSLTTLNH